MITRLLFQHDSKAFIALVDGAARLSGLFQVDQSSADAALQRLDKKGAALHSLDATLLRHATAAVLPSLKVERIKVYQARPNEVVRWLAPSLNLLCRAMKIEIDIDSDRVLVPAMGSAKLSLGKSPSSNATGAGYGDDEDDAAEKERKARESKAIAEFSGGGAAVLTHALEGQRALLAAARKKVLDTEQFYTAREIADLRGAGDNYPSQNALNLRKDGRIFGIVDSGKYLYPAFQLDEHSQPLALMREVLKAVPPSSRQWPLLLWFTMPNEALLGKKPKECLSGDADSEKARKLLEAVRDAFSLDQP